MRIIITGATGYVGAPLTKHLAQQGHKLLVMGRDKERLSKQFPEIQCASYSDDLESLAKDFDVCVHLATRNNDRNGDLADFRADNVKPLEELVLRLLSAGVKKHIYFSSILADASSDDPYSKSKAEAENTLASLGEMHPELQCAILRPAFVHAWPMLGKLAFLNPLPAPIRKFGFDCLATLRPSVRYKCVEAKIDQLLANDANWPLLPEMLTDRQMNNPVYRFLSKSIDYLFVLAVIFLLGWMFPFLYLLIRFDSSGPILFAQKRVGQHGKEFMCHKFRTMQLGTKQAATHEIDNQFVTNCGAFLRKAKIDELPQIWNILRGEMSLIGPRPCLPVQEELINKRKALDVLDILPGITGYSQVNHVDMSDPDRLAKSDAYYMHHRTLQMDVKVILQTALGAGMKDNVSG